MIAVSVGKICKCGAVMWTCYRCKARYCPAKRCSGTCLCPIERIFNTEEARDRWIEKHYPKRTASANPGYFYSPGRCNLGVQWLKVTEYPKPKKSVQTMQEVDRGV